MSKQQEAALATGMSPVARWTDRKGLVPATIILGLIAVASAVTLSVDMRWVYLLVYLWFGLIYGVFLQYGRFCMASAVRDLFAVKVPRMAVGVMIATALFSLTAAAVTVSGFSTFYPHPWGWHVVIGGIIFGFGMIFTGGCASGSLYKSGEGNLGSMLVVVSISISQAVFVQLGGIMDKLVPAAWTQSAAEKGMPDELTVTQGWFDQFMAGYIWNLKGTTLAEWLGFENHVVGAFFGNAFLGAILPTLVIVVVLYVVFFRKGYLKRNKLTRATLPVELRGLWTMLTTSKNTALAGLGLGVFAGLQMWVTGALREHYQIFNFGELLEKMGHTEGLSIQGTVFDPGYWYITTQEAQWAGWAMDKLGVNTMDTIFFGLENGIPSPLVNAPGMMSIGIILGAASIALLRREFKWKVPSLETAMFAIIGGLLMGIGARIGMGCNVGAFFAAVTNGDMTGWVFLLGMTIGAFVGVKLFNWWLERKTARDGDFCL